MKMVHPEIWNVVEQSLEMGDKRRELCQRPLDGFKELAQDDPGRWGICCTEYYIHQKLRRCCSIPLTEE